MCAPLVMSMRVAVGRSLRDHAIGDDAVGAGPVLDHHRLAELCWSVDRQRAAEHVGGNAGRMRR